ncbi:hypothetical protein [Aerosakkonema funiforme]|uniref:hypothetical protein n=1 Tax=Aerosakkonema funiforme TaxID=1246630 RepID=UPI0035B82F57
MEVQVYQRSSLNRLAQPVIETKDTILFSSLATYHPARLAINTLLPSAFQQSIATN